MKINYKKEFKLNRLRLVFQKAYGVSDGGFYHFPVLFFGYGSNGVMITILGGSFTFVLDDKK